MDYKAHINNLTFSDKSYLHLILPAQTISFIFQHFSNLDMFFFQTSVMCKNKHRHFAELKIINMSIYAKFAHFVGDTNIILEN